MNEIIDGMYEELKILENQLEQISKEIRNENDELKRNVLINLKQKIYNKIINVEDDIDEYESYNEMV